ncbi:choline transporter-like protein 2 isoform X2 [Histomonas meleagridis]|uniref:choline transporter-like protein 2 isoform X2 n=1 Tax=Histomonas meleagridis TaxID=135588 RepID=UPI00355AC7FE|nr:choline transporter-like protein 2 isoform X2 [Histomonas meleagridis]KAH0805980.1 choline transporter-like protein 2 isoform X2 [Histomonas meleagridis]
MEYGEGGFKSFENEDYGSKFEHDASFDGVDENRQCTDICMLIFFILFLCGMLAIFFVSLVKGNPSYLYIPTDHRGLLCGYDNTKIKVDNSSDLPNLKDKPYLFWVRAGKTGYARSFCVSQCPSEGLYTAAFMSNLEMEDNKYKGFLETDLSHCKLSNGTYFHPEIENYSAKAENISERFFCGYSSTAYFKRCLPNKHSFDDIINNTEEIKGFVSNISQSVDSISTVATSVQDLITSRWVIAACVAIALVLSICWLFLLRCCAAVFVWITVFLSAAGLALLTYLCYNQYKSQPDSSKVVEGITFGFYSQDLNSKVFKIFFYVLIGLDALFFVVLIFMIKRIIYSIKVIKCVSEMFYSVPSLFFFPILQYILLFIWWLYIIGVAIVIFGAGTPQRSIDLLDAKDEYSATDRITMHYDTVIQGFSIYHFIGFIWGSCFIMALGEMTVAGVVAQYYFASNEERDDMPKWICLRSLLRSLRFHTGSLAFGSLVITIFKIITIIIEYIDQKTRETQNTAIKCLIKCLKCCCICVQKFLKYINRNAYIMIAMHGFNFFRGCKEAFNLLLRNAARATALNWVGDFTLFLGRVFVAGVVSSISIFIFKANKDITFYIVPAVCVFVMSWLASGAFTGVFEMSIDATFLCLLEDEERNDGGPGQRRHTPPEMTEFMNNNGQN